MKRIISLFAFLICLCYSGHAQISDLAKIEYTYFPQEDSDNSFRRFKGGLTFPIKMGNEDSYLLPSLEYENVHFKYRDFTPFEKGKDMDRYQSFTLGLGYTYKMNEEWRVGIQGGVMMASNFERGKHIFNFFEKRFIALLGLGLEVFISCHSFEKFLLFPA